MKNYKDFKQINLGSSEIAALTLTGMNAGGGQAKILSFSEDGDYRGYFVNEEIEIPSHYTLKEEFTNWLSVYDDTDLRLKISAPKIQVYRAGALSCLIYAPNGTAKRKLFSKDGITAWDNV